MSVESDDVETLVSYRLGRLEKQIEANERGSIVRHESLVLKLEKLSELDSYSKENRLRIEMLEKSRDRLIGVVSVLGTGVTMVIVQMIFGLFGGK
jgi:ATP-dependent helicase YprA (DUF1998 family)